MNELDNQLKEVSLEYMPPADLHKFADELEFLELCELGHEERLERSFTNENGE